MSLLIADDNRDVADSVALLLKHQGFDVCVAYGGQEAIEAALSFRLDAFIMDLIMPILDGFQVARPLRAKLEFQHSIFVALTGHSDQTHLEASKAQFDEYLLKPPKMDLLLAILSEVSHRIGQ